MQRPTISACMIVKNEDKNLPTCLKSIRGHVDEIIVVDTGSTDRTVFVAQSFGARVYRHPWENHFSRHRNQSLSYATCDWILIIDADEELPDGSGEQMRRFVSMAGEEVDAVTAVVESPFAGGSSTARANSIRLIRNHRGIRYQGRVHNYLVGVKKAFCSPMRFLHHGYDLDKEGSKRKFKRTTELLLKDIQEDPANPRPHHFLAASYLSEGLHREAAQEAEEAIRLYEQKKLEFSNTLWSLYIASSAYLEAGELEKARGLARKGIGIHPDHLDSHYLLAAIAYRGKDHEAFHFHMGRYLKTSDLIIKDTSRFGEMVHNTFASRWLLHLFKGTLSMEKRDREAAHEEFKKAHALSPDPFSYHMTLGRLLAESGEFFLAVEELCKALELKPEEPKALWVLSYVYAKLSRPADQIQCIERLIAADPEFPHAHFQAGLACMGVGTYDKARAFFRKARSLDPGDQLAKINEALCLRGMARYHESIRLSQEIKPASRQEENTLLLNRACCYDALGQDEPAMDSFLELAQQEPESPESPVYLSRLLLRKGDIEACVIQCDRLLEILGLERQITLTSLADLGRLYFLAGQRLSSSLQREELARVCHEISLLLGCHGQESTPGLMTPTRLSALP